MIPRPQDADRGAAHVRRRPRRSRFQVEALEPRCLLSLTSISTFDLNGLNDLTFKGSTQAPIAAPADASLPDALRGATVLPVAYDVDVHGTLAVGDDPTLIQLPLSVYPSVIELRLTSASPNQPIAESLKVFDPTMQELASTVPDLGSQSLYIRLILTPTSTTPTAVYARISLLDSFKATNDPAAPPSSYVLEVVRQPLLQQLGPPSGGVNLPTSASSVQVSYADAGRPFYPPDVTPLVVTIPSSALVSGSDASSPSSPSPPPPPPPQTGLPYGPQPDEHGSSSGSTEQSNQPGVPSAIGMLPARSAAAMGGVLAAADPVPPVDPHEAARADLAAVDPAHEVGEGGVNVPRQRNVPVGIPPAEPDEELAAVLRGPGGLPLLATALIAGPVGTRTQGRGATPADNQDAHDAQEPAMALAPLATTCSTGGTAPTLVAASTPAKEEPAGRPGRFGRASILPGVAVAFVLGSGLMLPDLAAVFPFTRLSRTRLRLGQVRRAVRRSLSRS